MTEPLDPYRKPTKLELVLDFVKARYLSLLGTFLIPVGVGAYLGFSLQVPRWLKLFAITLGVVAPYGYVAGKWITSWLWSPRVVYLIDLDARETDGGLYELPWEEFRELDVVEGELDQVAPTLFVGEDVDLEAGTVVGTWRGTYTDRELLHSLGKVYECRGQLEDDAQRGHAIEKRAWSIVRMRTRQEVRTVFQTLEDVVLPDGEGSIDDAIDSALEEEGLTPSLEEMPEEFAPSPETVTEDETPEPGEVADDVLDDLDVEVTADD